MEDRKEKETALVGGLVAISAQKEKTRRKDEMERGWRREG